MFSVQQRTIFPGGQFRPITLSTITGSSGFLTSLLSRFSVADVPENTDLKQGLILYIDLLINPLSEAEVELSDELPLWPEAVPRLQRELPSVFDPRINAILRETLAETRRKSREISSDIFHYYGISFSNSPDLTIKQLAQLVGAQGTHATAKLLLGGGSLIALEKLYIGDPMLALIVASSATVGHVVIMSGMMLGNYVLRAAESAMPNNSKDSPRKASTNNDDTSTNKSH